MSGIFYMDTKSVRIRFICVIHFLWDAPHIYHFLYIYILALNIPPNSHKALRSDPALIEDTTFNQVRAIFAVMVVVLPMPAPARSGGGAGCEGAGGILAMRIKNLACLSLNALNPQFNIYHLPQKILSMFL